MMWTLMNRSDAFTMILLSYRSALALFLLLVCVGTADAQPVPHGGQTIHFGPPMRPNTLFAYKYTERVRQVFEVDGRAMDSSERVLSYFFTERQRPHPKRAGLLVVQANIDSMKLEVVRPGDTLRFNTQVPSHWENTKHAEVMGPSVLVNRMMGWTIDNYGSVISTEEKGFKDVREQVNDEHINVLTRLRILETIDPVYIRTIMLPWQAFVPVGRQMPLGRPYTVDLLAALDRTPFTAQGRSELGRGPDGLLHAKLTGKLQKTQAKTFTYVGFDDPITIVGGEGSVTGDMTLAEDGVVERGWVISRGAVRGRRGAATVTSRITHEVYYETIGTSFFDVIDDSQ